MGKRVAIHANMTARHHLEWAAALAKGFTRHGLVPVTTGDANHEADYHVVIGPWYCYDRWEGQPNVLFLDRCFFGDHVGTASVGWLRGDGSRDFMNLNMPSIRWVLTGEPVSPWQRIMLGGQVLILADYGQDTTSIFNRFHDLQPLIDPAAIQERKHPNNCPFPPRSLDDELAQADFVIGFKSTALIRAIMKGIPACCLDKRSPAYGFVTTELGDFSRPDRTQWLYDLAYAQWSHEEMVKGKMWDHLKRDSFEEVDDVA